MPYEISSLRCLTHRAKTKVSVSIRGQSRCSPADGWFPSLPDPEFQHQYLFRVPVIPQKTDCSAVVSVLEGQVLGPEGFQLSIHLSTVHLPRMWVEKHPDKDSQVCV